MVDKKVLINMIEQQEKTVKEALEQLKQLKFMAVGAGVKVKKSSPISNSDFSDMTNTIKDEITQKRNDIMERVEFIKSEAQNNAKQAMNNSGFNMPNMPNMKDMAGAKGMPMMPQMSNNSNNLLKDLFEGKEVNEEELLNSISPEQTEAAKNIIQKMKIKKNEIDKSKKEHEKLKRDYEVKLLKGKQEEPK